jgi:DNA-binding response OmpR family regulator
MREHVAGIVLVASPRQTCEDRAIHEQLCAAGLRPHAVFDICDAIGPSPDDGPTVLILGPGAIDDPDASDALAWVRRSGFSGMILVVGRSTDPSAAVSALDLGADDYLPLSCDATELVARVRALARRTLGPATLEREVDGLVLDLRRGVVRSGDAEVALTRREADLLEYLTRHAGHPVSREELATQIWHAETASNGGTNIVDVYVSYLRRKLGALGRQSIIRSVRGVGYELVDTRG